MQIEKIKSPLDLEKGNYKGTEFDIIPADTFAMVCRKINELVDAVNELQENQNTYWTDIAEIKKELQTRAENMQPDYVTTSYMTDGHTKEYYGQNGASIITDHPLPTGYFITIKEPETKGEQ